MEKFVKYFLTPRRRGAIDAIPERGSWPTVHDFPKGRRASRAAVSDKDHKPEAAPSGEEGHSTIGSRA